MAENSMTDLEKQALEFYKNGTAKSVLKRFVFSEQEKKLIHDAMRTAQRPNPRMILIAKADELLKEVAKTREPIELTNKTNLSAETLVQIEMEKLKHTNVKKDDKKIPFFYIPKTKLGRIIFFGMIAFLSYLQFTLFEGANEVQNDVIQSNQSMMEEQLNLLGIK